MRADPMMASRAALADADKLFADTRDTMLALQWIGFAAHAGEPIPPHMAGWLHKALEDYRNGPNTLRMDAAMGLNKRAKEQPKRRWRDAFELNDRLGRMWFLTAAGASREQAAVLVVALVGRGEVEQLIRSYGKSWFAHRTDDPFAGVDAFTVREFVDEMLAEYPDSTVTAQEKAAIRRQHPI